MVPQADPGRVCRSDYSAHHNMFVWAAQPFPTALGSDGEE